MRVWFMIVRRMWLLLLFIFSLLPTRTIDTTLVVAMVVVTWMMLDMVEPLPHRTRFIDGRDLQIDSVPRLIGRRKSVIVRLGGIRRLRCRIGFELLRIQDEHS
jgi:hypothetical protein